MGTSGSIEAEYYIDPHTGKTILIVLPRAITTNILLDGEKMPISHLPKILGNSTLFVQIVIVQDGEILHEKFNYITISYFERQNVNLCRYNFTY